MPRSALPPSPTTETSGSGDVCGAWLGRMEASGLAASARSAQDGARRRRAERRSAPADLSPGRAWRPWAIARWPKDGLRLRIYLHAAAAYRHWGSGELGVRGRPAPRRHAETGRAKRARVAAYRTSVSCGVTRESSIGRAPKPSLRRSEANQSNQGEEGGFVCGCRFLFGEPSESFRS
jgi:hypothetical protein